MTNYPYSSPPPPPSPPCNSSTSPVLPAPPPPPHPPPACTCNKATPTPPPPPPQPPSSHYSPPPPTPSQTPPVLPLPSPPPPPPFYYSPPVLSPPPPKSNRPSYFPSPPPPSSDYSRPPPPSPLAPSPYHFPRTPHSSPVSPLASPPNHHNSIPPNYYDSSLAPAPGLLPSSNEQRTTIVTACVSLGGVFFLAFIVIGLLSRAMKKKVLRMPRLPGRPSMSSGADQPSLQEFKNEPAGHVQELKSKPAGPEHVIEMGDHDPKVQKVPTPPGQGVGEIVEQAAPHETNSTNVTDKIGSNTENDNMDDRQGSDEEKLEKSERRSLDDDTVTDNADESQNVEEESAEVEKESNESKKNSKLRLPKKNKPSSSGVKKGKGKQKYTGARQLLNAACCLVSDVPEQFQDEGNEGKDREQPSESEAKDDGPNNVDKSEQPREDEPEECDGDYDQSLSHQNGANNTGSAQDAEGGSSATGEDSSEAKKKFNLPENKSSSSWAKEDSARDVNDAIGEESGDSKNKLCKPKKNKNPRNGSKKRMDSIVRQGITAGDTYGLNDEKQSQDDGNNADQVTELEGEEDDEELFSSGLNNTEEIVDQPTADEQEPHQAGTNNPDSSQNFEEGSNAVREETNDSKKKSRLPKDIQSLSSVAKKRNEKSSSSRGVKKGEIQSRRTLYPRGVENSQDDVNLEEKYEVIPQDDEEPYESEPRIDGEELTAGDSNTVDDERELDEPLSHQSERKNRDYAQLVEEEPEAVKDETSVFKNKLSLPKKETSLSSSGVRSRKERSSNNSQVLNTGSYFDLVGATQDDNNDAEEVHQLENVDDATSVDYTESVQCQEDENGGGQMQESEFQLQHDDKDLNLGGKASNLGMVSLDDVQGKVEVSGPFASAQGSKQALSIVMVHHGGDYKFDKAKVHELKAGSSKKEYSQERKDCTQVQEAEKLFNHGNTGTAASLCDPSMAMISFDDEDDKVQESEPIVSNVDTFLGQLHATGGGIEQSPNFLQNLSTTNDDDPAEELKRGYGIYKGKKAEVHQLSKDSRMIKGQIMVPRTGTKPRNFDKTVTARIGDNLGKGLVSLGGDQEGGSYKDGTSEDVRASGHTSKEPQQLFNIVRSLAATDEGDPNIELEIFEDDKDQLELEYPNKELSIKETSPVELEPSAEDQSVSVTGEDDPDVLQFLNNEFDEAPDLSNKDARPGKPLSRPRATNLRGKRRS